MYVENIDGPGRLETDMGRSGLYRRPTRCSSTMRNISSGKVLVMARDLMNSEC